MSKKISIVIPTYGRKKELKICLDSIRKQTHPIYEIIIVADKSTLGFSKEQLKYIKTDKRLIIEQKNKNLPYARNLALKRVTGEIICLFDDDTELDRNYIKEITNVFNSKKDASGVTGNVYNTSLQPIKKGILGKLMKSYAYLFGISGFFIMQDSIGDILPSGFATTNFNKARKIKEVKWLSGCNMCFSKDLIKSTGYFDESFIGNSYMEDTDYSYRAHKLGFKLYVTPFARLKHFVTPTQRDSLPKLKYYQLVNQKKFFYKNVYKGNILKWIRFKIAHLSLFIPILAYCVYIMNFRLLVSYFEAEVKREKDWQAKDQQ